MRDRYVSIGRKKRYTEMNFEDTMAACEAAWIPFIWCYWDMKIRISDWGGTKWWTVYSRIHICEDQKFQLYCFVKCLLRKNKYKARIGFYFKRLSISPFIGDDGKFEEVDETVDFIQVMGNNYSTCKEYVQDILMHFHFLNSRDRDKNNDHEYCI